jgi:nitrous oxidase accessory protein NosD
MTSPALRALPLLALLLASLLTGCPTEADDDDTGGQPDDDVDDYESGCITVNGEQPGYAHLQDAITVASDGDTIEVCDGVFEGSVVVDRALTILGQGPDDSTLTGDINEMTVTIENTSDVTLSGFTIETTRNAVVVQLSDRVVLHDLVLEASGQTAISADGSQVQITDSTFREHPYAAVDAQGGSVEVTGCSFSDLTGYGVRLRSSHGLVQDSEFESVVPQPTSDDTDGTCIFADDSTLIAHGLTVAGCTRVGIYGIDSDLDISSTTIESCANGIAGITGGASSVTDCTLEETPMFGILLVDQDATIARNTISATDPGDDTCGIAVGSDNGTFEISDNTVSGYGQVGIWVQYPFSGTAPAGGSAVVRDNTVTDVALHGVLLQGLDTAEVSGNVLQDITWSGTGSLEGGYSDGFGLNLWDIGELTLSDNEISSVDVVGLYILDSEFTSTGDEISETGVWGILASGSSGTFEELLINNASIVGVDVRASSVDFVDALIRNGHQGVPPEYWNDGWPIYYYAHGAMFTDSQCSFVDSWFLDNDNWALELYDTDVLVEGTTFRGASDYGVYSVYAFGEIRDSTFEDMTYAIHLDSADQASQLGDLTVADNTFSDVYAAVYSSNLARTTVFEGNQVDSTTAYGLYLADSVADGARVEVRDNSFTTSAGSAIHASGIELQIEGANTIDDVHNGQAAVALDAITGTISGLAVTQASGSALTADGSDITITGCQLVGSAGPNLELRDSTVQVLDNPALSQAGAAGIKLEGVIQGSITGNTIEDNAAYGIHCDSADVSLDACDNTMAGNTPADLYEENGCALSCSVQ